MKRIFGILTLICCLTFTQSCKDEAVVIGGEITEVTINSFPATDVNGENWDTFVLPGEEFPDLELRFNLGATISSSPDGTQERYDNADGSGTYSFDEFSTEWSLSELASEYTIAIVDYDLASNNEEMATFTFRPSSYTSGAPSSFTLTNTNGDASITVMVDWEFEE